MPPSDDDRGASTDLAAVRLGSDGAETLTLQEAANELGVHYMTVYRHVRIGNLPAEREGTQWIVRRDDLERYRSGRSRPGGVPADGTPGSGRNPAPWQERLEACLIRGDTGGSWSVVEAALAGGMEPTRFHLDVLAPAMRSIGDRWAAGELDVADEHRASALALRLIGRLSPKFSRRGVTRGVIVTGTPAGDRHGIPVAMFSDLLRGAGYSVVELGCDIPADSWARAVADTDRLKAVCIGVTADGLDDATVELVQRLRGVCDAPILIGGRAIDGTAHAQRLGADAWSAGPLDALEQIERAAAS